MENTCFFSFSNNPKCLDTYSRIKKKHFYDECIPPEIISGGSAELDSEVAFQHHNTLKFIYKVMLNGNPFSKCDFKLILG
ncbi:hypothetical protein BAU17_06820 [Enterococcus sp. CU12B]|uniref:Uncharacterized protein n=1 Tax=Candidatus Enterococcus willemsii TaxID=1857215 RepID=A0ABQ6Z0A5_9ENTE|nr:hypothetical protein BAU17_06820 [Enterococcus sp. CU12B]